MKQGAITVGLCSMKKMDVETNGTNTDEPSRSGKRKEFVGLIVMLLGNFCAIPWKWVEIAGKFGSRYCCGDTLFPGHPGEVGLSDCGLVSTATFRGPFYYS